MQRFLRVPAVWCILAIVPSGSALAEPFTIGTKFTGTSLHDAVLLGLHPHGRDPNFLFANPPDTQGAVGPNHIAELLNQTFATYEKNGTLQTRMTLAAFWETAFNNANTPTSTVFPFDTRLLYDRHSERWFATAP